MKKFTVTYLFIISISIRFIVAQNAQLYGSILSTENNKGIAKASISINELSIWEESNKSGKYKISSVPFGKYTVEIFAEGYASQILEIEVDEQMESRDFLLEKLNVIMDEVEVSDQREGEGMGKLRDVEEFAINKGKKNEVIRLEAITANVATNNPREIFKGIAGLNIHENDGAGLQLSIGGRGLDPNRSANFNSRQNGYDISADALGYPESYYTPPVQALKRIEVIRGAASLQYGPQFGGLLNFIFKDGTKDKAISFTSESTYGSFNLFNTFNSIEGNLKKLNYYSFYQYKRGDGQRPNSNFEQHTAFAKVKFKPNDKFNIKAEYTFMEYLAQQPGGLQDFEFAQDPYQSNRERNWFRVKWNLLAIDGTYKFNKSTRINSRNFFLLAGRDALGELGPINRPDPLRERDLVKGKYRNFGNETRFLHQYKIKDRLSTLLVGSRYYQGFTESKQGDASDSSDADFTFINPTEPDKSQYDFPSRNAALFVENLFNITDKFGISPGIRFEHIRTASDGYYKQRVYSGGQVIFEQKIEDSKENKRSFVLAGLGIGYRVKEELELYANFSQNFRSINFTDLAVQNPNLVVDSLLQDERGYNADIGMRGYLFNERVRFDATAFMLKYNNRIGITDITIPDPVLIERTVDFRTNVGDALIFGIESYIESDIMKFIRKESDFSLVAFSNFSFIKGKYLSGAAAIKGNEVELIPPINWKTGLTFRWKDLSASYQYSFVQQHYSDATNAEFVANATRGLIPSYSIMDLSASYKWKWLKLSSGINNLGNRAYFTRRTASYPGPGIIPAEGRHFYVSLGLEL